ncbi:cold shock domain-containing protein [Paracrocinitomix mangrovi]|uniref:cold-shock protein n=1 Tax=Paracrocinitomix mangrovi TaxID=2862509 RepID=UPI001C8D3232|nr:cold shock domain-containing protein [Paracrocinitomix mangrovi]UKN02325.1 cold shock domain-containing protein [Paracrocinitomix mangrovi]
MADSFSKKEQQKKKAQKKKEKLARKEERKAQDKGSSLEAMMAYVDENGVIVDTPPDENKKKKTIKAEDIELGIPKSENLPEEESLYNGRVTFFNDDKGYGFIKDKNSSTSYFVHMNNCQEPIVEGDNVQFLTERGDRGMMAVQVKKI